MEKEFLLRDVAKLEYGNKFDKNKMTHNDPCYNFIGRTEKNNGITDFVDNNGTEPFAVGTITLAFGGSIGSTFIQPKPYYTSQNVGVVTLPGDVSEAAKLYFVKTLEKVCKNRYVAFADEINKHFKTDLAISLPVIPNPDPLHAYTPADIDWAYMERRIAELEEERIAELDAYLVATGLDDCALTPEDEQALVEEPMFAEFGITEIFEVRNTKSVLSSQVVLGSGDTPYVTAAEGNNSIAGYIDCPAKLRDKGGCVLIGGKTMTLSYQAEDFCSNDSHNLALYPLVKKEALLDRKVFLFLVGALRKALSWKYTWGNSISSKKIARDVISLPVTPSPDPLHAYTPADIDWAYMERYIRAMEKLVMADVVSYKDKVIAATKQVVNP